MHTLRSLGIEVEASLVPIEAHDYVQSFPDLINLKQLHGLIDDAWDSTLLNHGKQLTDLFLAEFYSHPVWALNSIFSESDPQSLRHRHALAEAIKQLGISSVADLGGGGGTFLRVLKTVDSSIQCMICEPYMQTELIAALQQKDISWAAQPPNDVDAYTLIDVLEHLPDPLRFMKAIIDGARDGAYFFFGNCFYPVIKCHLPGTFYLRRTFPLAAKCLGLQFLGRVANAEYIEVYRLERGSDADAFLESLKQFLQAAAEMAEVLQIN